MQPRGPAAPAAEPGPLDEETHARVLAHQPSGMIQGITEKGLYLIRIRSSAGSTTHLPGTALELENVNVLGMTRHRDISIMAQAELHGVVKGILSDNPEVCLSLTWALQHDVDVHAKDANLRIILHLRVPTKGFPDNASAIRSISRPSRTASGRLLSIAA